VPVTLAGRIDRLVVAPPEVLVIDFKSDASPPADAAGIPPGYRRQLALYALVATRLFPAKIVRPAILWTALESLMFLPAEMLAESAGGFTMR
jgi:ATP-dependent helicase/nuclease subunit A